MKSAEEPSGFSAEEKRPEAGSSAATRGADQEGKDGRHWAPGEQESEVRAPVPLSSCHVREPSPALLSCGHFEDCKEQN